MTLPPGTAGAGALQVTVTANSDINGHTQITEANSNGNGTFSANQTITITSAAGNYPDLVASNLSVPATATGGSPITVTYTVTNSGTGAASATSWTDTVVYSTSPTANFANATVLGTFTHTGSLAPGRVLQRRGLGNAADRL